MLGFKTGPGLETECLRECQLARITLALAGPRGTRPHHMRKSALGVVATHLRPEEHTGQRAGRLLASELFFLPLLTHDML